MLHIGPIPLTPSLVIKRARHHFFQHFFSLRHSDTMSGTASNVSDDVASKQSSTLSRNALYTPLMAFEQTNVDPSSYMTTRKNIPSSLRESSLVDFIQTVSETTEKPLSFQAVEERIRQRALTLVGGGINSSMTGQQSKRQRRRRRHEQVSNRQRKRILT